MARARKKKLADEEIVKKNRMQVLIMLVALPLLSVFAVYSLVWLANRDTLLETTNRGRFVDPPVLARELALRDGSGEPMDGSGTWWVWVVTPDCDAACERSLDAMRALRHGLYDHADKVRHALVTGRNPAAVPAPGRYPWTAHFTSSGEKALDAGIYLVDPPGNVVLRYPADTQARPVLEDLVRLLEVPEDV